MKYFLVLILLVSGITINAMKRNNRQFSVENPAKKRQKLSTSYSQAEVDAQLEKRARFIAECDEFHLLVQPESHRSDALAYNRERREKKAQLRKTAPASPRRTKTALRQMTPMPQSRCKKNLPIAHEIRFLQSIEHTKQSDAILAAQNLPSYPAASLMLEITGRKLTQAQASTLVGKYEEKYGSLPHGVERDKFIKTAMTKQ